MNTSIGKIIGPISGSIGKLALASSGPFTAWLHPAPSTIRPISPASPSLPGNKIACSRANGGLFRQSLAMCICLSLFCFCGCDSDTPNTENHSDLEGRLEAAKLITSSSEKNAALVELAQIAGKAGDGKIVLQAVSAITHSSVRNTAAENAAPLLAKAGKTEDAIAVVKLINDTSLRNKIFAEIATQE